jgi:hypothetical protein
MPKSKNKSYSAWKTAVPMAFATLTVIYVVSNLAIYYFQSAVPGETQSAEHNLN